MNGTVVDQEGRIHVKCRAEGSLNDKKGEKWDDGAGGQIKHIALHHGQAIHSIQTAYERGGAVVLSRNHGSTNKGTFILINLDEPLTRVSGYTGRHYYGVHNEENVIKSLEFGTASATYGPFGTEKGTPFSFETGTAINGFYGNSDNGHSDGFLRAIGVYVRTSATRFIDDPPTPVVKSERA